MGSAIWTSALDPLRNWHYETWLGNRIGKGREILFSEKKGRILTTGGYIPGERKRAYLFQDKSNSGELCVEPARRNMSLDFRGMIQLNNPREFELLTFNLEKDLRGLLQKLIN